MYGTDSRNQGQVFGLSCYYMSKLAYPPFEPAGEEKTRTLKDGFE